MDRLLAKLAAFGALVFTPPLDATPITLSFEGDFTSVVRTIDCPVTASDCSAYSFTESISVPVSNTLSFSFGPIHDFFVSESHFVHPGNGRPVGFYLSSQEFAWLEVFSADFYHPLSIPQQVALPNPITLEYWNENLEWPGTKYSELEHAHLSRLLSQYDDNGEVRFMQSSWSVGISQNWYVTEGPPYDNVQYVGGLLLQGMAGLELTPSNIGEPYDNDAFLNLLHASACGYCLTIDGFNTIYDSQFTGLITTNSYSGVARLVAINGSPVSVPEPSTIALLILGLAVMSTVIRRTQAARDYGTGASATVPMRRSSC